MAHPAREFSYQLATFSESTRDDQDHVVVDAVNILFDFADHVADSPMHQRLVGAGLCKTCNRIAEASALAAASTRHPAAGYRRPGLRVV